MEKFQWINPIKAPGFRSVFTNILSLMAYLHQPVLWAEPGAVRGRPRVEGADVLARPGSVAVQVEAVAAFGAHQVEETRGQPGRVRLGVRMGLGLAFSLGRGLLETEENVR